MTTQIPHFIDGRRSNLASTRTADVLNPSTGAVQAQVHACRRPRQRSLKVTPVHEELGDQVAGPRVGGAFRLQPADVRLSLRVPAQLEQRASQRDPRVHEHRPAVSHCAAEAADGGGRIIGEQILLTGPQECLGTGHPNGLGRGGRQAAHLFRGRGMIAAADGIELDRIELFTTEHGHVSYGTQRRSGFNANDGGVMAS